MPSPVNVIRASSWLITLLAALVLGLPLSDGRGAPGPAEGTGKNLPRTKVEVRFTDGSVLKLELLEERFTLKTPYGKLVVPFADVLEIQFATRIPGDVGKRIVQAIGDLGSTDHKKREAATAELIKLEAKAYPALLKAEQDRDPEVKRRAQQALAAIRKTVPAADLEVRQRDVVLTEHSKIAGQVEATVFRAETVQFGEVRLKLSDIRTLRAASYRPVVPQMPPPALQHPIFFPRR
jgi:hypothetical protein